MIETEVEAEADWPDADWQRLGSRAVLAALRQSEASSADGSDGRIEVAIRLTSDDEVRVLNRDYRGKDRATNVLSFPMMAPDEIANLGESGTPETLLGDIVLAHGVCAREADEKHIALVDHAAHLIVHGMLHLLGYDHGDDDAAHDMESRERRAMAALGLHDPYLED